MKTRKIIKNWWNKGSSYYQDTFSIPFDDLYYGPFCPTEKELKLINVRTIKNKKVLELGCGGGQSCIFLAKKGAICSGIDISENQINYAIDLAKKNSVKIKYHVGSGDNMSIFENNKFDVILSIFSLQYIENLRTCLGEIKRILKKNGRFIFSLDHPFYSIISPQTMKVDGNYNECGLNEMIKTTDVIKTQKWHNANSQKFIYFFRNISEIYNDLVYSGLKVEKIIESVSIKGNSPWNKIYSERLSKNIPPTIIFVVKK